MPERNYGCMTSTYSTAYEGILETWDVYVKFAESITPRDIIPLLAPCSIALLAYLQWRINPENSRRYFSEKLLEHFAPIQSVERIAFTMLSAQKSYNTSLALNKYSEGHGQAPFMKQKEELIAQHASDLENALGPAYDSMFTLSLFLGLHRSETPTEAKRFAKDVHGKILEFLTFAQQCKTEIIEYGWLEVNGKSIEPIIDKAPDEARAKLSRLHTDLIKLLTSQYKVANI